MRIEATEHNQGPVDRMAAALREMEEMANALMGRIGLFLHRDLPKYEADVTVYKTPYPGAADYASAVAGAVLDQPPEKGLHPVVMSEARMYAGCAANEAGKCLDMLAKMHEEVRSQSCARGILVSEGGGGK